MAVKRSLLLVVVKYPGNGWEGHFLIYRRDTVKEILRERIHGAHRARVVVVGNPAALVVLVSFQSQCGPTDHITTVVAINQRINRSDAGERTTSGRWW